MFRILIGAAAGLVVGAGVGWVLKARGGTCPLTCNPYGGAIFGALLGGLVAASVGQRGPSGALADVPAVESEAQFDELLGESDRPVLADFYTDSCGFCVRLAPTIAELHREYAQRVRVVKVNAAAVPDLARRYQVTGVPTVILFENAEPARRWVGLTDKREFIAALEAATTMMANPEKENTE